MFKNQLAIIIEVEMLGNPKSIFLLLVLMLVFLKTPYVVPSQIGSPTLIEGAIFGNVMWELAHSPYVLTDDFIIGFGSKLTIESGVEVRFDGNFTFGVNGSLYALGKENNPIVFTSNEPKPVAGDWNTIEFAGNSSDFFIMNYSVVEYARIGLTIKSVGTTIVERSKLVNVSRNGINVVDRSNIVITGNTIQSGEDGISVGGTFSSGMVITGNHITTDNGTGIHFRTTDLDCHIYNITIDSNVLSSNDDGIRFHNYGMYGSISEVSISGNLVDSSGNGIYLFTYSWYDSVVSDVTISENEVLLCRGGDGIYVNSDSAWSRYIFNVIVSGNKVSNASNGIYVCAGEHIDWVEYDATVVGNRVANGERGISIVGVPSQGLVGLKANVTSNSISYNSLGVSFDTHAHNSAHSNNIYGNQGGMQTSRGATVNATNNYWGDSTGPYHITLNPAGRGNSVGGNGTDVDFRPFLSTPVSNINESPVAVLQANTTQITTNGAVKFTAIDSLDDSRIDGYFLDFGDGTNSSWTALSTIEHNYAFPGVYNASLVVIDDLGFLSENVAIETITVFESERGWIRETPILTSLVVIVALISGGLILIRARRAK